MAMELEDDPPPLTDLSWLLDGNMNERGSVDVDLDSHTSEWAPPKTPVVPDPFEQDQQWVSANPGVPDPFEEDALLILSALRKERELRKEASASKRLQKVRITFHLAGTVDRVAMIDIVIAAILRVYYDDIPNKLPDSRQRISHTHPLQTIIAIAIAVQRSAVKVRIASACAALVEGVLETNPCSSEPEQQKHANDLIRFWKMASVEEDPKHPLVDADMLKMKLQIVGKKETAMHTTRGNVLEWWKQDVLDFNGKIWKLRIGTWKFRRWGRAILDTSRDDLRRHFAAKMKGEFLDFP